MVANSYLNALKNDPVNVRNLRRPPARPEHSGLASRTRDVPRGGGRRSPDREGWRFDPCLLYGETFTI